MSPTKLLQLGTNLQKFVFIVCVDKMNVSLPYARLMLIVSRVHLCGKRSGTCYRLSVVLCTKRFHTA